MRTRTFEINCPHCNQKYIIDVLLSGNTFGAIFFSDGYIIAPMLIHVPLLRKCINCNNYFWRDDPKVEYVEYWDHSISDQKNVQNNPKYIKELSFEEYVDYLEHNKPSEEREIYVRTQIRHLFNHNNKIKKNKKASKIALNNLQKLMELYENQLDNNDVEILLSLAEIYRNLKYFDKAIKLFEQLLSNESVQDYLKERIEKLLYFAKNNEYRVVPF